LKAAGAREIERFGECVGACESLNERVEKRGAL
jgi:hypothetical protein